MDLRHTVAQRGEEGKDEIVEERDRANGEEEPK